MAIIAIVCVAGMLALALLVAFGSTTQNKRTHHVGESEIQMPILAVPAICSVSAPVIAGNFNDMMIDVNPTPAQAAPIQDSDLTHGVYVGTTNATLEPADRTPSTALIADLMPNDATENLHVQNNDVQLALADEELVTLVAEFTPANVSAPNQNPNSEVCNRGDEENDEDKRHCCCKDKDSEDCEKDKVVTQVEVQLEDSVAPFFSGGGEVQVNVNQIVIDYEYDQPQQVVQQSSDMQYVRSDPFSSRSENKPEVTSQPKKTGPQLFEDDPKALGGGTYREGENLQELFRRADDLMPKEFRENLRRPGDDNQNRQPVDPEFEQSFEHRDEGNQVKLQQNFNTNPKKENLISPASTTGEKSSTFGGLLSSVAIPLLLCIGLVAGISNFGSGNKNFASFGEMYLTQT